MRKPIFTSFLRVQITKEFETSDKIIIFIFEKEFDKYLKYDKNEHVNMEIITNPQMIINKTMEDFGDLKESVEKGIEGLMIVAIKVCQKSFELKSRKSQLIIFIYSDIVETIQAIYKLCLQGHYESSAKLLRNSFDSSFVLEKFNSYNDISFSRIDKKVEKDEIEKYNKNIMSEDEGQDFEIRLWIDDKIDDEGNEEIDKIRLCNYIFSTRNLIRQFSESKFVGVNLKAHSKLCEFIHPTFSGILSRLKIMEGYVKFAPVYKKEYAENILKDIFKSIVICRNVITKSFPNLEFTEDEMNLLNFVSERYEKLV